MAASAALTISDIPFKGPIAAVRVGLEDPGKYILNPTEDEKQASALDLVVACNKKEIVMIEAEANQVDEKQVTSAIDFGLKQSQTVIGLIEELAKEVGKPKKEYQVKKTDEKTEKEIKKFIQGKIIKDFQGEASQDEGWFSDSLNLLKEQFIKEEGEVTPKIIADLL